MLWWQIFWNRNSLEEVSFIKNYIEKLKKDAKYYIGQNFIIDEKWIKILDAYKEFLKANEGFIKTQNTTDVKLPDCLKNVEENDLDEILAGIERVIDNGKLYELTSLTEKVL